MALGRQIVSDLGLEPGVDTLGKWMAHHIAELISNAEVADPESKRSKEALAAEAISKLWQHRSHYENRINPLHELRPILEVLHTLDPNKNFVILNFGGPDGKAFARVYDALRRLVILMIIRKAKGLQPTRSPASAHHSADEGEIIASIQAWFSDEQREWLATPDDRKAPKRSKKTAAATDTKDPNAIVNALIANARQALDQLAAELSRTAQDDPNQQL